MDLNQAMNLTANSDFDKYRDYNNIAQKHVDYNNNYNHRTFDINPTNIRYNSPMTQTGPQPYQPTPIHETSNLQTSQPMQSTDMSESYLRMKHSQENQTAIDSYDANYMSINQLKQKQAKELQQNLQKQTSSTNSPIGLDPLNFQNYANASGSKQAVAYNAQGETVTSAQSLYQDQANRYNQLKNMSPEMLNSIYGRQSDQSVIPQQIQSVDGDIYDQTSCFKVSQWQSNHRSQELKTLLENRKHEILQQKSNHGIQSYNFNNCGTNLVDAFSVNKF